LSAFRWSEIAPAKINLALHVRGLLPDGRHALETMFAFCTDGDRLRGETSDGFSLELCGPFAAEAPSGDDNLVLRAGRALAATAGVGKGGALRLEKMLPVASGIGGGSADAAAALRLLTAMWGIDPSHASATAATLGSDVPACLLSMTARGEGAGDSLQLADAGVAGAAVLLVNPRVALATADVFQGWNGIDQGPLEGWRDGWNGLEQAAIALVPQIETVLAWLSAQVGASAVRMSGSGATCFALFDSDEARDRAADAVHREWWHLATSLR
jgi:4-diphosphocytidyl-2-C-methyl-D-erythritol kinase